METDKGGSYILEYLIKIKVYNMNFNTFFQIYVPGNKDYFTPNPHSKC